MPFSQAIGVLIVRLWVLGLVARIPTAFVDLGGSMLGSGRQPGLYSYLFSSAVGIIGLLAFAFAKRIASPLARLKIDGAAFKITGEDLVAVGTFLIGFYFLLGICLKRLAV